MADQAVTSAFATGATERDLILSIVQDELNRNNFLRPTIMDLSSQATKGAKTIDVPKFDTGMPAPLDQNVDGLTPVDLQSAIFDVDTITLNKWKNLAYRVPDRVAMQSAIAVEAELAKSAGARMGEFIDDQIITNLRLASTSSPDHDRALDGGVLGGAGPTEITLEGISKARELLNRANVPQSDRWLVIPPEQEKALIDLDNFRNADKYGSRDALLRGEIGRIYGFRVMVHNGLTANEAVAYHTTATAVAVQQEIKFESQRADVTLQATDFSFSLGMGDAVLDGGKRQVYLHSA